VHNPQGVSNKVEEEKMDKAIEHYTGVPETGIAGTA